MEVPVDSDLTLLAKLAASVGATEPALRLLLSILVGYPLGLIHRYTLYGRKYNWQHIYFICGGLLIGYFNYGWEVLHSVGTVLITYLMLSTFGGTLASVLAVISFTMGYLLVGYYVTGTETYDIKWSMPQCVLTLRLIGLSMDIYDGTFPSVETGDRTLLPHCLLPGFKRGILGFIYLGIYQVGTSLFPDAYLLSPEYDTLPFYQRCLVLGLWGKITLYKYISCWLISEGVCIMTGLTFNGRDSDGHLKWDGCANVRLMVFEGATEFGHFITSFNTNTNNWLAQYIYKRLKFLNNRYISQFCALLFLAVWHGLHSGYYMCFYMEFIVMYLEKDLAAILKKSPKTTEFLSKPFVKVVKWILLKLYTFVFMGYCLLPFALLSYVRWWQVYKSIYFIGHIVFGLWPIWAIFVRRMLIPTQVVDPPSQPQPGHSHSE